MKPTDNARSGGRAQCPAQVKCSRLTRLLESAATTAPEISRRYSPRSMASSPGFPASCPCRRATASIRPPRSARRVRTSALSINLLAMINSSAVSGLEKANVGRAVMAHSHLNWRENKAIASQYSGRKQRILKATIVTSAPQSNEYYSYTLSYLTSEATKQGFEIRNKNE